MTTHLEIALDKQLNSAEVLNVLCKFYPDSNFRSIDELIGNNCYPENLEGTFQLHSGLDYEEFKHKLEINIPPHIIVDADIEIKIAQKISKTFKCRAIVSGDFYDETRFPFTWILIDDDKYYEASETLSEYEGLEKFEIIKEIKINPTANNG